MHPSQRRNVAVLPPGHPGAADAEAPPPLRGAAAAAAGPGRCATWRRPGFAVPELTDGPNLVTVNPPRRFPGQGAVPALSGYRPGPGRGPRRRRPARRGGCGQRVTGPAAVCMAGADRRLPGRRSPKTGAATAATVTALPAAATSGRKATTRAVNPGVAPRF